MATNRTKSRVAMIFAAMLLFAAATVMVLFSQMTEDANPSPSPEAGEEVTDPDGFPVVDWDYWKSINPDVIGWVTVPGTKIDYPILQAHSNSPEYYLHHDIYGNWSVYGVPYLDAENEEDGLLGSANAVVFGHHMNDGSMFAAFADYSTDKAYAKEHAKILVQTPETKAVYHARFAQIINGLKNLKRTEFGSAKDYRDWYDSAREDASVVLDEKSEPTTVITWCTCSYNYFGNERTLVYSSAG